MTAAEKLAKILRADKDYLGRIEERFSYMTGKKGVLDRIVEENDKAIKNTLAILGVGNGEKARAEEIYHGLIFKMEADDNKISEALGRPVCSKMADCEKVLAVSKKVAGVNHGFFLKEEKAVEFLEKEPPKKILSYLGYDSVDQMLSKENLFEVYSALRFIEGNDWLNGVFFKQYEGLTVSDFEERPIVAQALGEKWAKAADSFMKKKWHNISHLKELGVVFVIPATLGIPGELLRMMSLVFHYLHEIPFYSDMFRRAAETPVTFAPSVVSLLRGDVFDRQIPQGEKSLWLVIQRYLAKDDENDWRLFAPHLNPEALHWSRAEEDLVKASSVLDGFASDLIFWQGLGWIGDYFKDSAGNDILVSFDLVDTVMSLVMKKELVKYLYHHQEALWNRIFIEYMGEDQLEKFCKNYLLEGYFEI
ncbi:hypothetical protein A2116_00110 [Candidatus Jorgensenbacteria bacterium GWA1_49_17]|uniref:Glycosidase related protein n=1 Tax=Candidatus Jorgensenbacteria bacterium GWA1_49_17 TaxID=1798467 RepID=A0A1F6BUP8_9BACT|nr:MAG: hypothetical protein A2116_00110 [Candidatus Jorgensenbacteria bacterium GWA1_49_17]